MTWIVQVPSADLRTAILLEFEADHFIVDRGTLIFSDSHYKPVLAFASGQWETVEEKGLTGTATTLDRAVMAHGGS